MVQYRQGLNPTRLNQLSGYNGYVTNEVSFEKRDYIFETHITVDERYFILHDEVYDIQEKTSLGNIWGSVDVFKTIFKNVQIDNSDYRQIQEGWDSLPLLEGSNDLYALRDYLLEWSFFDDTWVGRKMKSAGEGLKDFAETSWDGIKKMGVAISKGDWSGILNLLGKGIIYILRKLKEAAYSTMGMIVDAILVATGIGKGAQVIVWGLITALDVYQLINNDWPSGDNRDMIWKYMDLGFDLLGLVFAGVAAKGARSVFKPLSGLRGTALAQKISKSPQLKSLIQKIFNGSKNAVSKLQGVATSISKKWPTGFKWISKIISGMANVVKKLQTYLGNLLKKSNLKGVQNKAKPSPGKGFVTKKTGKEAFKTGLKAGGAASLATYGIEKGIEAYTGIPIEDMENMSKTMDTYNDMYGATAFDTFD